MRKLVSVYMPTKNRLTLATRAIESVLKQTYKNMELIVVDDGSELIQFQKLKDNFKDHKNVIFLRNEESLGACKSRNRAIKHARGEFITGLDDDDYFSDKNRITYFVNTWTQIGHKSSGLFDSLSTLQPDGKHLKVKFIPVVSKNDLKYKNHIGSQVFAPTQAFVEADFFDPKMPAWQDWDMWFRITQPHKPFVNINKNTYMLDRAHGGRRISEKPEEILRLAKKRLTKKMGRLNLRQKAGITASFLAYKQVNLSFKEIIWTLLAFRPKQTIRAIYRKLCLSLNRLF